MKTTRILNLLAAVLAGAALLGAIAPASAQDFSPDARPDHPGPAAVLHVLR